MPADLSKTATAPLTRRATVLGTGTDFWGRGSSPEAPGPLQKQRPWWLCPLGSLAGTGCSALWHALRCVGWRCPQAPAVTRYPDRTPGWRLSPIVLEAGRWRSGYRWVCGQCLLCVLTCPLLCATLAGAEPQARGQGGAQRPEAGDSWEVRRSGSGRAAREWTERGRCGWKGRELTGLGGAWGPSGGHSTPSPAAPARAGVSVSNCPRPRVGLLRPWPGPGEMHYINVNFPSSWAPSFNKLSARHCQSNFSHSVSLFSVWGNPVSLGRGRLAAGKVQLCRDADRPT